MAHQLIYEGKPCRPVRSTYNGQTVDVITQDGKRHVAVPLTSLDTWWQD